MTARAAKGPEGAALGIHSSVQRMAEMVVSRVSAGPQTTTELRVEAVRDQLPIIQAVAQTLAHRRGFLLTEIADITHAVDEVGAALIDAATHGSPLRCSFEVSGSAFLLTTAVTSRRGLPRYPGARWRSLEAVTDRVLTTDLLGEKSGEREVVVAFIKHHHGHT
ncbi:anti-sigma factor [Rhodococcus koreensis]|uniref:anti-sigma factor n=1 Tax=Rhodococcus koreensis TaxID=99653 RepID=UPI0036D86B66